MQSTCIPVRQTRWPSMLRGMVLLWILLVSAATSGLRQDALPIEEPLARERIEAATKDHGAAPLTLNEARDPRLPFGSTRSDLIKGATLRRGVVLTPYVRFLELSPHAMRRLDAIEVVRLAAPELWIVVFPYSRDRARALVGETSAWRGDLSASLGSTQALGNPISWPTGLRVDATGEERRVI